MKLRSALIAGFFAALMAGNIGCPCGGIVLGNDDVPGAETYYFCDNPF